MMDLDPGILLKLIHDLTRRAEDAEARVEALTRELQRRAEGDQPAP